MTTATLTYRAGQVLGARYSLVSPIASGGMGEVWAATDDVLGRDVAVKLIRASSDDGYRDRFRDEARHSAALHHPNIAAVFDYGDNHEAPYLVMELVPGQPLSALIETTGGDGLEPDVVRSIAGQAALALAAAHESGVVHRDVKPANIIVTPDGQAKLTDFGIARPANGKGHTLTGEVLGTPEYLSPEQALGETATEASDLYALGVIAHEMLTGSKPFDAGTPVATAVAQVSEEPPPLPPTVPDDLRSVVEACLAKSPEERPADARALADALLEPLGGMPLSSLPASVSSQPSPTRALPAVPALGPVTDTDSAPHLAGVDPAPSMTRAELRKRAQRHTAERRRPPLGWLAVPLVALLAWGAFALGSLVANEEPTAATPQPRLTTPALVGTPMQTPAQEAASEATPTTVATTARPGETRPNETQAVAVTSAPEPTRTATPTETRTLPGKGLGRGKGNNK
ncbi:MAG TPA: protein kinase [Intrasporangium sp.]|jgi:serine/threonine-protein kinase|uniref:serine/threonine-protein kinase n=1 Tax=Intrasporangium sp. TaxID=1925024 RepID=UPI002F93C50E